jgi:tRNA(fMet)-specific endonuclease VapC
MSITHLLDTNICIYIVKHNPRRSPPFAQHPAAALAMSIITLGELRHGAEKSQRREQTLASLDALETVIQVVDLTDTVAHHCGNIRSALERAGTPIGNNDVWIAAHARANGWTLVTNNEREFLRVERLVVENWVRG